MGFPMLLTAVWLFQSRRRRLRQKCPVARVFLVFVASPPGFRRICPARTHRQGCGRRHRFDFAVGGYAFALENQLHWRRARLSPAQRVPCKNRRTGLTGSPGLRKPSRRHARRKTRPRGLHRQLVPDLPGEQKDRHRNPVRPAKAQGNQSRRVVGDYTHFPDSITAELNASTAPVCHWFWFIRKNPDAEPIVLPEVLTPGIVLDAAGSCNSLTV